MGENPPRVDFFQGYPIHIDGLEHDAHGWPTANPEITQRMQTLRMQKIDRYREEIIAFKEYSLEDAEILIFSFGISARAALEAVNLARAEGDQSRSVSSFDHLAFSEKGFKREAQTV